MCSVPSRRSTSLLPLALHELLVFQPFVPVLLAPLTWSLAGLGMGFAFSTISLVVLDTAPAGQEGTASSAMQLANW